ncbi:MAG TPA: C45 family autoproteolytic acyltransferase/hydrolase [Planctomycetota bacterium]|nr:C45 family autoproteolytic acyltransferase/hydrolase [Planctomycetota bacterium]
MRYLAIVLFAFTVAYSQDSSTVPEPFRPDPVTVQWYGPAYCYPQAGWVVLHIEGEPHERGVQHGKLLYREIEKHIQCLATHSSPKAPNDGWDHMRTTVNALFLRHFDKEYLEEMQGIADGAADRGAKWDGRPLDLTDIVALNVWAEIMTLDAALHATPTGLEDVHYKDESPKPPAPPQGEHCSSFIATGPATADGKIVFGHISMYDLYPSSFFNVWIDLKPSKGHRILMQTVPGGIQSGLDYYITDAGLLCSETTIAQTRYDINGAALTSQIRKALQYSDSIDTLVAALLQSGNGLYANEWLIGDIKTNEIAMFELGTKKSKLYRSSKNEWYGGTEGFYWGDNNAKDRDVRLETLATFSDKPVNTVYHAKDRDRLWYALYQKYKGHIDANFGRMALTSPPICAYTSADAKYTTSDAAKNMESWALFGPPLGRAWQPTLDERANYPAIEPMVSNPWTVVSTVSPSPLNEKGGEGLGVRGNGVTPDVRTDDSGVRTSLAVDLAAHDDGDTNRDRKGAAKRRGIRAGRGTKSGWHGTLFAKTDADLWLATAFADYEKIFSQEEQRIEASPEHCLCADDKKKTVLDLHGARSKYLVAAAATGDVPLLQIKRTDANDDWYRICSGKGLLVLHELRALLGDKLFAESMDSFGTQHAGQEVTSGEFVAHMEKAAGKDLKGFFDFWLNQAGLPRLGFEKVTYQNFRDSHDATSHGIGRPPPPFVIYGTLRALYGPIPSAIEITIETEKGEITSTIKPDPVSGNFTVGLDNFPIRPIIIDKYRRSALANGNAFRIDTFMIDLNHTLIVYGTGDETATNLEAAEELQKALLRRGPNVLIPIRTDKEITDAELRTHHLLLIGRPDCNKIVRDFASAWPVKFGPRSFKVGNDLYAHARSAVAAVGANPLDPKLTAVVIAGLSPAATYAFAPAIGRGDGGGEVAIFEAGGKVQSLILPAPDLIKDFDK